MHDSVFFCTGADIIQRIFMKGEKVMQEYWLLTDMDGVLVEFNKAASIEDLYSKEYFLKQKPMLNVVKAIRMLQLADNGIRVGSCSKYLEGSNAKKIRIHGLTNMSRKFPLKIGFSARIQRKRRLLSEKTSWIQNRHYLMISRRI